MAADYPTKVVDKLKETKNNLTCDLTADVADDDDVVNVLSTTGCPTAGSFHIENEVIFYTGVTASSFTGCTRGQDGTTAADHLMTTGGEVMFGPEAHHVNSLNEEMVAMQTALGITGAFNFVAKTGNEDIDDVKTFLHVPVCATNASADHELTNLEKVNALIAAIPPASAFWTIMPGTPTRVGDTSFTITDTGNANKYDLLLKKGTIIKWDEGGTFQWGMVITATYGADAVTVTIVGDSLTAGFDTMKYCASKAQIETFIVAGVLAALTDTAKTWITPYPLCVFSADLNVKVAGTGAGANTVDINDDGTTMFTTKPSIAENVTADIDNVSDNVETVVAAGSLITIDVDAITATTAPTDAYVKLYYCPEAWRYQS